jgi:hypothetical protein
MTIVYGLRRSSRSSWSGVPEMEMAADKGEVMPTLTEWQSSHIARLGIHAASTISVFLIETWQVKCQDPGRK